MAEPLDLTREVILTQLERWVSRAIAVGIYDELIAPLRADIERIRDRVSEEEQSAALRSFTGTAPQWLHDLAQDLNIMPTIR